MMYVNILCYDMYKFISLICSYYIFYMSMLLHFSTLHIVFFILYVLIFYILYAQSVYLYLCIMLYPYIYMLYILKNDCYLLI